MSTWGILKNNNCLLYPINGIEEHLHSVPQLQPSVALASLVKNIKLESATLMKHEGLSPNFNGGQQGYQAFNTGPLIFYPGRPQAGFRDDPFLPALGDNTNRQTDQWEMEERAENPVIWPF